MSWFVDSVVCDYGVFELTNAGEHKLLVVCNSRANALTIADILNKDDWHELWKPKESEAENDC